MSAPSPWLQTGGVDCVLSSRCNRQCNTTDGNVTDAFIMDSRLQPLPSSVTAHAGVQAQSPLQFWTCARPTLDGVTLMRYAHIYRSQMAAGMEHYLRQLDRALLTRYRMRIIQTYLTDNADHQMSALESYGRGETVWIPIYRTGQQRPGRCSSGQRLQGTTLRGLAPDGKPMDKVR